MESDDIEKALTPKDFPRVLCGTAVGTLAHLPTLRDRNLGFLVRGAAEHGLHATWMKCVGTPRRLWEAHTKGYGSVAACCSRHESPRLASSMDCATKLVECGYARSTAQEVTKRMIRSGTIPGKCMTAAQMCAALRAMPDADTSSKGKQFPRKNQPSRS